MSDEVESGSSGSKRRGAPPRDTIPVRHEPEIKGLFLFLYDLFEEGFPDKVVLNALFGPSGKKKGPAIKEFKFKPSEKPSRDDLVELTNTIVALAQEECEVFGKSSNFGAFAFDVRRSADAYERKTFNLKPKHDSLRAAVERGEVDFEDDDDVVGGMSTKLLMSILGDERRDKRWMMEMLANIMSGSAERDAARIEMLEDQANTSWDRSLKYISATEQMLSQAEDRKARAARQEMYNEMMREGVDMLRSMVVPAVTAYISKGKVGISQGIKTFIDGLSEEAEEALFGKWEGGECREPGVLEPQQVQHAIGIAEGKIDPKTVTAFVDGITPEQQMAVQQLVERGVIKFSQIQALMALSKAARDIADKEAAAEPSA